MRFDVDFKVFVRCFIGYELMGGEVFGQINGAKGVGNVIDMFALLGGCTI